MHRVGRRGLPPVRRSTCNDGDSTSVASATRTASIRVGAGETVRCTFVNTKLSPAIEVVKAGPDPRPPRRHDGRSRSPSRNVGNSPLHAVHGHRRPLRASLGRAGQRETGDDGDALLETGEVWTYSCSKPGRRTSRQRRSRQEGEPVTDTDRTATAPLHPRSRSKTPNRDTAAGDTIAYRFDVTNPGDTG